MNLKGKTLAITGGASGIGRGLAFEAASRGVNVAISDRDEAGARETQEGIQKEFGETVRASVHVLDVSDLENWQHFRQEVLNEHHGTVDGLINNAGITFAGTVEETDYERYDAVMSVNFMGMVYGSKEFLSLLKERPEAALVNVSSLYGLLPKTSQSAYCASKYAIRGFTEVLAQELKRSSVVVTSVHPGHVGTDILLNAQKSGNVVSQNLSDEVVSSIARDFKRYGLSPREAGAIILDGVEQKRRFVPVGKDAERSAFLSRLLPKWYVDRFNREAA